MITSHSIKANYFDGHSSRSTAGYIQIKDQKLIFVSDSVSESLEQLPLNSLANLSDPLVPISEMAWPIHLVEFPEDLGQQFALISLPNFASIEVASFEQWRTWSEKNKLNKGFQKFQLNSMGALLSFVLIVLFGLFFWIWGIPFMAEKSLALIPQHIDETFGETALEYLDKSYLTDSDLTTEQKNQIEKSFIKYIKTVDPILIPNYQLVFRSSRIGPNAFALPGGSIVMTDEIVDLFDGDERALFGVFAHELGHVKNRDAMKSVVQVSALGILMNLWIGDFSSTLAAAPVLIGQAQYSRDVERTADSFAATILKQAKISPLVMVKLFKYFETYEAIQKEKIKLALAKKIPSKKSSESKTQLEDQLDKLLTAETPLGIDFNSHPANKERIEFFKKAAIQCQDCSL